MIKLRPAVKRFAEEMEKVLRKHDNNKGGWDDTKNTIQFLRDKLDEEYLEVKNAEGIFNIFELVDISNICMMLFSRYACWSKKYLK